jgi:hypothetical protein
MPHQLKTGTIDTIRDLINGAVLIGPYGQLPLGGLTMIWTAPAATVTFPGAAGAMVSARQIADAINGTVGLAGYAQFRSYEYGPHETNRDGGGKVVPKGTVALQADGGFTINFTGTANALLGLSTVATTVSAGIVPAAKIIGFTQGPAPGQLCIIISP